jgi:hypothetical protein
MKIFELQATFPAPPPDEPDTLTYFVRSTSLDEAKARLKEFGGENIRLIRELSEEQAQELRKFLRTT